MTDSTETRPPTEQVDEVGDLEQAAVSLRDSARVNIGFTGSSDTIPLRQLVRAEGASFYPLFAIAMLGLGNYFQGYAVLALAPDIARTLGISVSAFAAIQALVFIAETVSPFPMAWLTKHKARRALLCLITAATWSVMTLYMGFVTSLFALFVLFILDGLSTGSVRGLHVPLLVDNYPPRSRVRMVSAYLAFGNVGLPFVTSAVLVVVLTGPLHLTWRGVFVVLGICSLLCTALALRLRDPGFGKYDTDKIKETVHEAHHEAATSLQTADVTLGVFEVVRRLLLVPTLRRILIGDMVLGIFSIPLNTFISFFLDEKFGLGPTARGFVFAGAASAGVIALALFGKRGEGLFQKDPARVPVICGWLLTGAVLTFGLSAFAPNLPVVIIMFCIGFGLQIINFPLIQLVGQSLVEAKHRPHYASLAAFSLAVGGLLGALFLSGIERRFGIGGAFVALIFPGVIAARIVASAKKFVDQDLDRMITHVIEGEEIARIQSSGGHLPMLSCRSIDFSYGKLQVLFDVDFTVDDGEMVALLGVNGAGKSTLLKVVSGIGLPTKGSVRFRGQDVTYLDAERRLRLGITQVPGGRAVFAPLTVIDNLRVYGYALNRKESNLNAAIERSFAAFPRLYDRRNQLASTLSGGEQQMLGLCKALILQPRLLLIDELSLGLAPVIVGQLLEMVREINASGTAVVLVEQSVNIALSAARHAYFMERGQIRFDGPSDELLERGDLLRAVFLEGAGKKGNL